MKISRDWLEDYIDLGGVDDDALAATLTSIGHAVEGIESHEGDTVLEIEFTANRLDAMSHRGLARELSAALDRPLEDGDATAEIPAMPDLPIRIDAPGMCTRYVGTLIRGVSVGPSEEKVRRRLEALGHRSINNIVDITNYVMLATGHPLHAFDYDRLAGQEIIVRAAREGETIETLDGLERKLNGADCVIADAERAVALGGVIGGANSEIDESTTNVLLECAHFDPVVIRLTARRLGISTDASYRFERGVDPSDAAEVSRVAAAMIAESAGATIEGINDVVARAAEPLEVSLRKERLEMFSAGSASLSDAERLLTRLGMNVRSEGSTLRIGVPTWRGDIEEEIDLIEEVLRLNGYEKVPSSLPRLSTGDIRREEIRDLAEEVRDLLRGFGLAEVVTYSFLHPDEDRAASTEDPAPLTNALTENISVMRTSVIPGLLQVVERNTGYGTRDGGVFEVARTYHSEGSKIEERDVASFILFGTIDPSARRQADYLDAKGIAEALGHHFRAELHFRRGTRPWAREGQGAEITIGDRVIGFIGVMDAKLLRERGHRGPAVAGEISLAPFVGKGANWTMTPVSRYPGVPMALAMMHDPDLAYETIETMIRSSGTPHLREIGLWDRFQPKEGNRVKTTLAMWYQADDRSLTQDEVSEIHEELTRKVMQSLNVEPA